MLYWMTSVASVVAVWLNIQKRRLCFAIWAVTNAIWAYADFYHGLPAQGVLQLCYFALSLHGLWCWRGERRRPGV